MRGLDNFAGAPSAVSNRFCSTACRQRWHQYNPRSVMLRRERQLRYWHNTGCFKALDRRREGLLDGIEALKLDFAEMGL
jgi:hypothetical protein